jgi:hypothetical protein
LLEPPPREKDIHVEPIDGGGEGSDHTHSGDGRQDTHSSYTYAGHQGFAQVETAAAAAVTVMGGENEDGWATPILIHQSTVMVMVTDSRM